MAWVRENGEERGSGVGCRWWKRKEERGRKDSDKEVRGGNDGGRSVEVGEQRRLGLVNLGKKTKVKEEKLGFVG
ncbi:hypothetical protein GOBAR_DD11531 [Gossypium barbadense]|nr:hypothetical protein GOBAR_DD11531 [Gossypium barbadense]